MRDFKRSLFLTVAIMFLGLASCFSSVSELGKANIKNFLYLSSLDLRIWVVDSEIVKELDDVNFLNFIRDKLTFTEKKVIRKRGSKEVVFPSRSSYYYKTCLPVLSKLRSLLSKWLKAKIGGLRKKGLGGRNLELLFNEYEKAGKKFKGTQARYVKIPGASSFYFKGASSAYWKTKKLYDLQKIKYEQEAKKFFKAYAELTNKVRSNLKKDVKKFRKFGKDERAKIVDKAKDFVVKKKPDKSKVVHRSAKKPDKIKEKREVVEELDEGPSKLDDIKKLSEDTEEFGGIEELLDEDEAKDADEKELVEEEEEREVVEELDESPSKLDDIKKLNEDTEELGGIKELVEEEEVKDADEKELVEEEEEREVVEELGENTTKLDGVKKAESIFKNQW